MNFINYNGQILSKDTPIVNAGSRALKYGDGLFETLKYADGKLAFLQEHFNRLWEGLETLGFDLPAHFSQSFVEAEINKLLQVNNDAIARVRLSVLRGEGSLPVVAKNDFTFLIESAPLPGSNGVLNKDGLKICIYSDARKSCDKISALKHNNFLPYVMAAKHAGNMECDDALLLNNFGNVCETSIANIFFIKNNVVFTPSLAEGCIAGILRQYFIQALHKLGFVVEEKSVSLSEALSADECFISNSILMMRWVITLENKQYEHTTIQSIYNNLLKTNPSIFC